MRALQVTEINNIGSLATSNATCIVAYALNVTYTLLRGLDYTWYINGKFQLLTFFCSTILCPGLYKVFQLYNTCFNQTETYGVMLHAMSIIQ